MRQPRYGVSFARAGAVLDQVVQLAPVLVHAVEHLVKRVALMIAREYNRLLEDALVTDLVVLLLAGHEDELRQKLDNRIESQDIVPEVMRREVA